MRSLKARGAIVCAFIVLPLSLVVGCAEPTTVGSRTSTASATPSEGLMTTAVKPSATRVVAGLAARSSVTSTIGGIAEYAMYGNLPDLVKASS